MSPAGLEIIDPAPVVVEFRGERVEVRPLTLGKLPAFVRLVRPIIAEFTSGKHPSWLEADDVMVVELMELHGESIVEATALATGRTTDYIGGVRHMPELVALVRAIVEVNRDFFIQAMKVVRRSEPPDLRLPAGTGGGMPSSSSSVVATH